MHSPLFHPRSGYISRLKLSARGSEAETIYRSQVSSPSGPTLHHSLVAERTSWASLHGLEPDDGAYLLELSFRPLTMGQLGEALAVYSQTREMVSATVQRLVVHGLIEVVGV